MSVQYKSVISLVLSGVLFSTICVHLASAGEAAPMSPTKEMRQQMAQAHDKMAACLRSDRDFTECRQEMMRSCTAQMAAMGCGAMMGQGMQMQMRNQMRSGSQQQSSASTPK